MCKDMWRNNNHSDWLEWEKNYYKRLKADRVPRDRRLENLQADTVKNMSVDNFYDFLHNEYFVWKYTAKNRLSTTRSNLVRHKNNMAELKNIHSELFSFDLSDIEYGLRIAGRINGLGIAGASGLLSILFPEYFGTVDQFVVIRLKEMEEFSNNSAIHKMNEKTLKLKDGILLTEILRKKAKSLNNANNITYWTPRKIDKVLWALNR